MSFSSSSTESSILWSFCCGQPVAVRMPPLMIELPFFQERRRSRPPSSPQWRRQDRQTRADDDHVDDFVPLLLRRGDGDGGACKSRTGGDCTLDEMTAGKIGHGKFLLKLTPDEPTSPEAASGDSALRPDGTRASTGRTLSPFVIILLSTGAMRERTNPHPNHLPLNSRSGLYVTTTVLDRTWKDDAAGVLTPQRPFLHGNRRYTLK